MPMLLLALLLGQPPVEEIMARVAENQARAQDSRREWVYHQSILVRLHRGDGKLAREEAYEYLVTPTPDGQERQRLKFAGKYERKGQLIGYDEPGFKYKDMDIDGELAEGLAEDMVRDRDHKDGIQHNLFPLTPHEQQKYSFRLAGEEMYQGTRVYRVLFQPKSKDFDALWKGEALIETTRFQPVLITTTLGQSIPLVVKTLLGTNIKQLGFKIVYRQFAEDLWFPESYGGEFDLRALFLYRRKASLSVRNTDFRRTEVTSRVTFEKP
jgi:hypothetical protein